MYVHHYTTTYLLSNLDPGCTQRCLQKGLWKCNRQRGPHKHKLFARIWLLFLGNKFMEAYKNVILVICGDDIMYQLFLHIFCLHCRLSREVSCSIYLHNVDIADMYFRMMSAMLKKQGCAPCPHCLIWKDNITDTGTKKDVWHCRT